MIKISFRTKLRTAVIVSALVVLLCAWLIDARSNRMEANLYMMCQKQMGPGHCYHGSFSDPYFGLKSS